MKKRSLRFNLMRVGGSPVGLIYNFDQGPASIL